MRRYAPIKYHSFVSAEHSDSSTSLSTHGVQNGIAKDQRQYQQTVSSQPQNATSQPVKNLIDYASTWHRQHQSRSGQSFPASSFDAERKTGLAWSQTLPSQHQRPPPLHQPILTSTMSASGPHPGTYPRGHRRTQSSSNIVECGTGNSCAVGVLPQTSDGDYDRLDDRGPRQPTLVVEQLDRQQPKFATLPHLPQFHQLHQLPLVGAAAVQSPQFVSVQQQQQHSTRLAPTASVNNRHRRTHSTGVVDQFRDGAGGWSHQQQYATLNEGLLHQQSQAPIQRQHQQPIAAGGINGDAWGTSVVGVQHQRSADTVAPSSSTYTGSLPGNYMQQQQHQQQQLVASPSGHRVQQITVNNICYEPQTLLRQGPGWDVTLQTVQPSASFDEFHQATSTADILTRGPSMSSDQTPNTRHAGMRMGVPEVVLTPCSNTSAHDRASSLNATIGYRDGMQNGFSTATDGSAFQQKTSATSSVPTARQQQGQQQHEVQRNDINGSTLPWHSAVREPQQQAVPSWQQQQQYQQIQSTTSESQRLQAAGTFDRTTGRETGRSHQQSSSTAQRAVNGPTSAQQQASWQQQPQQQQQQQQQPNKRQNQLTATSPEPPTPLTDAIDAWDRLMNVEIDNRQLSSGSFTPGSGTLDRRLPPVERESTSTPQSRQQFFGPSADVTPTSLSRGGTVSSTYPPIAPEDYTIKETPGSGSPWPTRSPQERNGSVQRTSGNSTDTMDNSSLSFTQGRSSGDSSSIFGGKIITIIVLLGDCFTAHRHSKAVSAKIYSKTS